MKTVGLTFEEKAPEKAAKPKQAKKPAAPKTEAAKVEKGADGDEKPGGAAITEPAAPKTEGGEE